MSLNKVAIIGGGNMGASLLGGLIANNVTATDIIVTDHDPAKLASLQHQFNVLTTHNNQEACKEADIIILAVKPQVLKDVVLEIKEVINQRKPLIISIAAGIKEKSLQQWLGGNNAIVRAMPNTPALIGCGATGLFANSFVSSEQRAAAEKILHAVGLVVWVDDENLMDSITALSGSGPAYFFLMMEIMQKAGEKMGLSKDISKLLTIQTAFGAARMALESEDSLEVLRQRVTSPGGTTEKAITTLEGKLIRDIFSEAIFAAEKHAELMAEKMG